MSYKYETHLHTIEGSACGSSYAADYIKTYKDAGYTGIFVTDHFFGGNTAISRDLDWKTRIELYCKGYENALAEAEKVGNFSVFFGIEQTFKGDDYLLYGLTKEWLLENPQMEKMTHKELFDAVNSQNGLMIQAHPFRLRDYMPAIHLHPREVHGVEIFNAGNKPDENQLAELYAKQYGFSVTSGSDIHNTINVATGNIGGMEFDTPITCVADYVQAIKNKQGRIIRPL